VIGVDGPFTGECAKAGEDIRKGAIIAFEDVNYTILGRPIKVVWVDDEGNPEKGRTAWESAVLKDGVQVFVGGWLSSVALADMELAAKYKIVHLGMEGGSSSITEKYFSDPEKYKYWFKGWPLPETAAKFYASAIKEIVDKGLWTPRNKKYMITVSEAGYGRTFGPAIIKEFGEIGWEEVSYDIVPSAEVDYYPLLTKAKANDVSLHITTFDAQSAIVAFLKQAREVDLHAQIIGDNIGWIANLWETVGTGNVNYVLDELPKIRDTPQGRHFKEAFKQKFGYEPTATTSGLTYDWVHMILKAIEKAGTTNGDVLVETIRGMVYEGVVMPGYSYTKENGPDPICGEDYYLFPVVQYFNGSTYIVWPSSMKEADFRIPPYAS
jgi:branched-chain amino acid transport system substrate-binding protein